ncbi:MAG TPA: hypothetical protein VGO60_12870 [Iamia sp.]|jgi:hypothetical protein|nr:hypothetical protein [Iamia sp.]
MKKLAALLGSLAAVLLLAAPPAGAHGGPGEMEITSITRSGDDVTVTVHLIFTGDGDGVPDATVTVVVDDGLPVTMEPGAEEGDYTVTVPADDGAAIRVTSVEPATTAEGSAPAAGATETTAGSTTTPEASTTTSGEDPPTTQAPADTAPEPNGIDEAPDDDGGGGGSTAVLVVVAVVIVAALGAAFYLRRKRPGQV